MFSVSFSELASVLEGTLIPFREVDLKEEVKAVSIDSRTLSQGDLFFAIEGTKFDGHHFLEEAFKRKASGAIISDAYLPKKYSQSLNLIQVNNPLAALQQLGIWNGAQSNCLRIGVTGSVGKTTTRHMIHTVLSQRFPGIQSPSNYNNQIGVPLSLLQLSETDRFGVFEVGASAQEEIAELSSWILPEISVLTRMGPAHLDGFGSFENILSSKAELLECLDKDGLAVLPIETAAFPEIKKKLPGRVITTGRTDSCLVQAKNVNFEKGILTFVIDQTQHHLTVPGIHFLDSALIAWAIAREWGISEEEIQAGFDQFSPLDGRCNIQRIGSWSVIDDCYNANPVSVKAGLSALMELKQIEKRIVVFGDMLGLGELSSRYHFEIGTEIVRAGIDTLIACGEFASDVVQGAISEGMDASQIGLFENFETMKENLEPFLSPGRGILIKGSRKTQMERVLTLLKQLSVTETNSSEETSDWKIAG